MSDVSKLPVGEIVKAEEKPLELFTSTSSATVIKSQPIVYGDSRPGLVQLKTWHPLVVLGFAFLIYKYVLK